jgi:hypothetical protein
MADTTVLTFWLASFDEVTTRSLTVDVISATLRIEPAVVCSFSAASEREPMTPPICLSKSAAISCSSLLRLSSAFRSMMSLSFLAFSASESAACVRCP